MPYILLPLLLLLSLPAHAVVQKFGANEHNTIWISEGDNKFRCTLKQTIPNFGEATFRRLAGGTLQLQVALIHPNRAERELELISRPPLWRHQQGSHLLDSRQLNEPTTQIEFGAQQARLVLTELEQGLFPTIRYFVAEDDNREVNAAISSVNFQPSYHQFLTCLSQLMPYQFEYVKESNFYFHSGKSTLSAIDKRRLNEIITYIKADPSIKWAQIKGYTDSRGFRHLNDKLGEERAKAIQDYLTENGLNGLDITVKSYGERKPLESNRTTTGRALNRVAIFTLFDKEPAPPEEIPEFEFENIFDTLPKDEPQYKTTLPRPEPEDEPALQPQLLPLTQPAAASPERALVMPPSQNGEPAPSPAEPANSAPKLLFAPITPDMVETGN
jgi:outer membrane protein OmpA-like peptidoglycan-associated protein